MKLFKEYGMDNEFANKRFLVGAIDAHMLLGPDFEGRHAVTGTIISEDKVFNKYISEDDYDWISSILTGINMRWIWLTDRVSI